MGLDIRKMVSKAHCYADNYLADRLSKWYALRKAYADGYKEAYNDIQERAKADSNNENSALNLACVSVNEVTVCSKCDHYNNSQGSEICRRCFENSHFAKQTAR